MSEPLNCNESVDIVTPTREEWDQNQFRATPGPAPSRCAPVPPTLPPPYHERICSLHPLGKHTNSSCRNQLQTARDVHIPHSQASCRTRGVEGVTNPQGPKTDKNESLTPLGTIVITGHTNLARLTPSPHICTPSIHHPPQTMSITSK